jgi:uncharacterized protein (DUF2236 family)
MTAGDPGLFGPDSVTWRIHADPCMLVGGLRALMIQALNPRAMAAVADHSGFRADPWGRLRRTAEYVTTTTFGDTAAAELAGARVRAIHDRISGVDAHTGRPYDANEPELLAWIHNVEVDSFLAAYRAYGGRLSAADADRYVAENVRVAELVGLRAADVPHSVAALQAYLAAAPMEASVAARRALPVLVAPPSPGTVPGFRAFWTALVVGAVAIMPERARRAYGLAWCRAVDPAVRLPLFGFLRLANHTLPASPAVVAARERASAGAPAGPPLLAHHHAEP